MLLENLEQPYLFQKDLIKYPAPIERQELVFATKQGNRLGPRSTSYRPSTLYSLAAA